MVGKPAARDADTSREPGRAGVTTEHLLERYRLRRSRKVLDQVVELHRSAVEKMARNLATRLPRSVDVQDLIHAGMWGLMQAVSSYEPERCDSFSAFMRIRVKGAMLDELRHMDFLPRLFRRRVRERDAAQAKLLGIAAVFDGEKSGSARGVSFQSDALHAPGAPLWSGPGRGEARPAPRSAPLVGFRGGETMPVVAPAQSRTEGSGGCSDPSLQPAARSRRAAAPAARAAPRRAVGASPVAPSP